MEKEKEEALIEELENMKKELNIKNIQLSDLENQLIDVQEQVGNTIGLNNSLKKTIEEYERKQEERALKYNNIKRKTGPLYNVVLKIKKILEK